MSAVDKLHKVYSTRSESVVWARSVGLEIVNELDTLKSAIMMSAGASGDEMRERSGSVGWSLAANSVEALTRGAGMATAVGSGLRTAAAGALQQLAHAMLQEKKP
jgi:ubiquinone biosynthesis monooxygenase Coq6